MVQSYISCLFVVKDLWDAIWGFVAVDKEMIVQGVYFDHKGETPGLRSRDKTTLFYG